MSSFKNIFVISLIFAFMAAVVYVGCQNFNKVVDNKSDIDRMTPPSSQTFDGCYLLTLRKDTSYLKLVRQNEGYVGELKYQKIFNDKVQITEGPVNLYKYKGHFLKGYHMVNKGPVHYVEKIYRIVGDNLIEGYGDTQERHDTLALKFPDNVEYDLSNPFKKVPCAQ